MHPCCFVGTKDLKGLHLLKTLDWLLSQFGKEKIDPLLMNGVRHQVGEFQRETSAAQSLIEEEFCGILHKDGLVTGLGDFEGGTLDFKSFVHRLVRHKLLLARRAPAWGNIFQLLGFGLMYTRIEKGMSGLQGVRNVKARVLVAKGLQP